MSTIKGYRAMLSSVFKFCLPGLSTSPILKDLVRSFEISAPRPLHQSPSWDLDKVLEYLSGPPFEPLADASFWNKTRKPEEGAVPCGYGYRLACGGTAGSLILSVSSRRRSGSPL